jgi:hypothetical protein
MYKAVSNGFESSSKNANHLCALQRKQLRRIHFKFVENFRRKKEDAYPNEETGGNAHTT